MKNYSTGNKKHPPYDQLVTILESFHTVCNLYEITTQSIKTTKKRGRIQFLVYDEFEETILYRPYHNTFYSLDFQPINKRIDSYRIADSHSYNKGNNLIAFQLTKNFYNYKNILPPKVFDLESVVLGCAVGDHVAAAFTPYNVYFFDLEL